MLTSCVILSALVVTCMSPFGANAFATLSIASSSVIAFTGPTVRRSAHPSVIRVSTLTMAAAKKRRRKGNRVSSSSPPNRADDERFEFDDGNGSRESDLPEFDLVEDDDDNQSASTPSQTNRKISALKNMPVEEGMADPESIDMTDPRVLEAMKGTQQGGPASTTKELLRNRDRDMEKKLIIDESKKPLPNLAEIKKRSSLDNNTSSGASSLVGKTNMDETVKLGKKAARKDMRRAAALEAEAKKEKQKSFSFLSNVPYIGTKEGEELTPVKILEKATWAGIFLLVLWEFYLNSPFFYRAAPLAPVVYHFLL